ncbi:LysR family transcriptional regulator [Shewanella sp. cp20]|uniref:LysR family transcriptional regulator n=1 Tax=Shewanella sp. cp20 TaxID=1521167 RepID=UPI002E152E7A
MLSANILVNLYEKHSASSVAMEMNIPAPKVSRCLQHARMIFNDPLFIRKKHGLEPNDFTRQLYPLVKALVQCGEQLHQLEICHDQAASQIMVLYVSDLLIAELPQRLSGAISEARLPISYELRSGSVDLVEDLAQGLIDLAIVSESSDKALQDDRLSVEPLKQLTHLYLLCSLKHPLLQQEISLANIANYPYLSAFGQFDKLAPDPFQRYCAQHKLSCHPAPTEIGREGLAFNQLYRYLSDDKTVSLLPYSKVYEHSELLPGLHVCCLSSMDTKSLYQDQPYPRLYMLSRGGRGATHLDWLKQEIIQLIKQNVH